MTESDNNVNAPHITLQALIETSFDVVKLLTLKSTGATIAKKLGPADDPLDALARLELGKKNFIVTEGPKGGKLVLLKNCPYGAALKNISSWSDDAKQMVQRFNQSPRGGAALHPICIAHLSTRESYGAINLGCRSAGSGQIAVSVPALLDEVGHSEEEVREQLEGQACLYWLRNED